MQLQQNNNGAETEWYKHYSRIVPILDRILERMKKFNIYNITQRREEKAVMGESAQHIIGMYRACGEEIRIMEDVSHTKIQPATAIPFVPVIRDADGEEVEINDPSLFIGKNIAGMDTNDGQENQTIDIIPQQVQIPVSIQIPQQLPAISVKSDTATPSKYFSDNGCSYMIKDGEMYKKEWIDIVDQSDIRVINEDTRKVISSKNKIFQRLDWVKINA